jgi:hypothetical protein
MITKDFEIIVRSEICLMPGQCYPVETYLPVWVTAIFAGMIYLIGKEFLT